MKGINVSESLVNSVLDFVKPGHTKKIEEAKAAETAKAETKPKVEETTETAEEPEDHVCPLCESKLEQPLTQEQLKEHVDYFLRIINENFDADGESLDEETDEDSEEDDAQQG